MWPNWPNSLRAELNRYSPGGKLPSSRALVERFRVSPVTVSRALAQLAAEGLVVTRPGSGAFRAQPRTDASPPGDTSWQEVSLSARRRPPRLVPRTVDASGVLVTLAAPPPGVIEFNGGYLHPSLQPERALAAALARAGRRPGAWGRPPVDGLTELRAWFAREIGALAHRRRRADHRGRPERPDHRAARPRPARRPGPRRIAHLPGHAGGRPRHRTAAGAGAGRRRRGATRTARRRLPGHRRPGFRLPAALPEPDRRGPRPGPARRSRCGSPARRGPSSSRTTSRAGSSTTTRARCRRRWPPTTPTASSSTSARSPRRPRPACGWARWPPADRYWNGCVPSRSSTTSSCPARSRRPPWNWSAPRPGGRHLRSVSTELKTRRTVMTAALRLRAARLLAPAHPRPAATTSGCGCRTRDERGRSGVRLGRTARGRRGRAGPPLLLRRTSVRPGAVELRGGRRSGRDHRGSAPAAHRLRQTLRRLRPAPSILRA